MKASSTGLLIVAIASLALLGFYPTYFSKFPEFAGLTNVHHFHGAMMMSWFTLLIAQPFLISYKKNELHRFIGKFSYVIAPLVVISIFLVSKLEYYDDALKYSRERSLAGLDVDLMSLISFAVLYALAIYHRRNMALHMRYMICTGLLIFIPGFARLLQITLGIQGGFVFLAIMLATYGTYISLIIIDRKKGNPVTPYLVGVGLAVLTDLAIVFNKSAVWQGFAGMIVDYTY